jgi:uncharacterized delta-60 repeat protein
MDSFFARTSHHRAGGRFTLLAALGLVGFNLVAALPANRDATFQTLPMDGLPNASLVLPDGKILLGGNFTTLGGTPRPGLARLNADGSLDESFAPPVGATSPFGKPVVTALVRLPDGRFIAAGQPSLFTTGAVARTNIIRFHADGSVDPTFNANAASHLTGLTVQADGKVLYNTFLTSVGAFGPARLNADGSPDATFRYVSGINPGLQALQLQAQADGHTLALQGDNNPSSGGLQNLFWLKADGALDPTFKFPFQLQDESRFVVAPDGSTLVAGYVAPPNDFSPQILRLAGDGTRDASFSFLTQPNNQGVHPVPAAFLPDGGAVLVRNPTAGDRRVSFFYLTAAGKLTGSLDLPNAVNDRGVVGLGTLTTRAFAMQPDGKLLFAQAFVDGFQNIFGMFRLPVPPAPAPPVITVQPESKTIGAGESLFLNVTATSGNPPTFQWFHSHTNLPRQTNQFLNLSQDSLERAGDFLVVVANAFATVTSRVATITVRPPAAMVMTQQPNGGTIKLSQSLSLTAQFTTEVTAGYQWFKDGASLPSGGGQAFGLATLNLLANDATRAGDYFVVITNAFGDSLTSRVVHVDLILPGPPQLTTQPTDLALFAGQPVQLSVAALADGAINYQWLHAGTNLLRSATIPNVNAATLFVNSSDPNRAGEYSVVATVTPGGSVTSRVAQVTLLPSGPPILLNQPATFSADFGATTNVSVAFNGEAPLTVFWEHAGTNLLLLGGLPGQQFSTLTGPTTNSYAFAVLPSTSGDYRFIATNRFGGVTSTVATVTMKPPTPATLVTDLTNTVVGIGEFNFVALRQGLIVTNLSTQETTHTLAFRVTSGLAPFRGDGLWQLALGVSNRFYVGENTGAGAATGTWAFAPAADNYLALTLTNFPRAGDISRLEAFEDGQFGVTVGGNNHQSQAGTFRVLGNRRPATNTFTLEVVSPNPVSFAWFKDGAPLDLKARVYLPTGTQLGTPPTPGGVNQRVQLSLPDLQPTDAGTYSVNVTNLFPNPDKSFGQPPYLVTSVTRGNAATLTVRGFTETDAPPVVSALEFGSPTALDEPTAVAVLDDNALLLAVRSHTFGGGSSTVDRLNFLTPDGRTNWQVSGSPAQIRAVLPDGQGGAILGGHIGDKGDFFLRRVRPVPLVAGGRTNFTVTNVWSLTAAGPSTNAIDTSGLVHGAEVIGLQPASEGVLVAGRFRGQTRFGATNVPFIGGLSYPIGGVTLTNSAPAAFDRTWDLYVAKYSLDGQLLWVRGYGGTNDDTLTSFTTDAAGNLFLAGSFKGRAKFGNLTVESTQRIDSPTQTFYATDGFVAKLAPDGTPVWVKNFGGLFNSFLAETLIPAAVADATGSVFFTATRNQTSVTLQPGLAVGSRYLARLNPAGELQWAQTLETVGNADSLSGLASARLALDAAGNVALADAFPVNALNQPIALGAASVGRRPFAGTVLAKFTPSGTLLWARALDEILPFTDDPRSANTRLLAVSPTDELVAIGSLSGGTTSAFTRTSGQRFDTVELFSTNNATANPTDVFIARLAPSFEPAAPLITVLPSAQTGLLQDPLTLTGRATGVPAPTFQWLLNGAPLPGATNRLLTFLDLQRTNRGRYALVVSNAYGVVTSAPVDVTPQLRPNMTGWTMVTSATNFLGQPEQLAADDAGNVYLVHTETARGAAVWLEKFNPDGHWAWRYSGITPNSQRLSPLVAQSGEVFIVGNVVTRLDPADSRALWNTKSVGGGTAVVAADFDGDGRVRVAFADRTVHRFDFNGTALPVVTLANLPHELTPANYRVAFDRAGGFYFYGNRVEAINLGPTNLAPLGNNGAQTWVLARYDATGAFLWSQTFSGPTVGLVDPFRLLVDAAGNALIAGNFGIGNQANLTFQIGTNQLKGYGYTAKVTPAGDVAWAKAWWLNVDDAALDGEGSVYLTGWFRSAPTASGLYVRQVPFGTNLVAGSSLTGHDTFVAKLSSEGSEDFIRHTGSPNFKTFDNAHGYKVAVNASGLVWTAGFSLFQPAAAALDFGDLRYQWPDLRPYNIGALFGDLPTFYVARLELAPPLANPELTFALPPPGSSSLRLNWPPGYKLQHRAQLHAGDWETLMVTPPYDANLIETTQGYFRVIP